MEGPSCPFGCPSTGVHAAAVCWRPFAACSARSAVQALLQQRLHGMQRSPLGRQPMLRVMHHFGGHT
jgi:hypothetical protein